MFLLLALQDGNWKCMFTVFSNYWHGAFIFATGILCFIVCTAWTSETLLAIFGGSVVTLSFGKYALWANCRTVWASASLRNLRMVLADFPGLRVTCSRKLSQKSFWGSCVPIPAHKKKAPCRHPYMRQQDASYNQSFSASSTFIR